MALFRANLWRDQRGRCAVRVAPGEAGATVPTLRPHVLCCDHGWAYRRGTAVSLLCHEIFVSLRSHLAALCVCGLRSALFLLKVFNSGGSNFIPPQSDKCPAGQGFLSKPTMVRDSDVASRRAVSYPIAALMCS